MRGAIAVRSSEEKIGGFDRWEVRNHMETLEKAHKIKADTKMMKAIGELAKEKLGELAHIVAHTEMSGKEAKK
jgi:hypothetical protein